MPLTEKRWFSVLIAIVLFLVIVFLLNLNQFILTPIAVLFKTIFVPFVIAGILFYLCRPLVHWLEGEKVPKWIAIIISYLAIVLFFYLVGKLVGPVINAQLDRFIENLPLMVAEVMSVVEYIQGNQSALPTFVRDAIENFNEEYEVQLQRNLGNITTGVAGIFGFIGGFINFIFYLVLVPIILFYMLNDYERFAPSVSKLFPKNKRDNILKILSEMDRTISAYIQGQVLVAVIVGILLFIGYLIIGLNYPLVLAMFGMFTNIIPFLGPYLAVIPAFLVALFQDPILALYVAIVMFVAQQIEGNIISPNVMGKVLKIHPLTIIVLILTAGNLLGILGIIFVIPTYAVAKVFVIHVAKMIQVSNEDNKGTGC